MAALDPRDPPSENRTVTVGYLNELYAKADKLRRLEAALRDLIRCEPDELDGAERRVLEILLEEPL